MTTRTRKNQFGVINIVENVPNLSEANLGDMFFVLADEKIYIRTQAGWKSSAALT